jgi:thymidine phosphorylase
MLLGAGRERKGDPIDLGVGIVLQAKIGDRVWRGQPLAVLHANDTARAQAAAAIVGAGVTIRAAPLAPPPLLIDRSVS